MTICFSSVEEDDKKDDSVKRSQNKRKVSLNSKQPFILIIPPRALLKRLGASALS